MCYLYAFRCNLNVVLERIELFNTVQCILYAPIVLLKSIDLILAHYAGIIIMHLPAYYALNYAGIFDRGLLVAIAS